MAKKIEAGGILKQKQKYKKVTETNKQTKNTPRFAEQSHQKNLE